MAKGTPKEEEFDQVLIVEGYSDAVFYKEFRLAQGLPDDVFFKDFKGQSPI